MDVWSSALSCNDGSIVCFLLITGEGMNFLKQQGVLDRSSFVVGKFFEASTMFDRLVDSLCG